MNTHRHRRASFHSHSYTHCQFIALICHVARWHVVLQELWVSGSYRAQRLSGIVCVTAGYFSAAEPVCVCARRIHERESYLSSMWKDHPQLGWTLSTAHQGRMSNINRACLVTHPECGAEVKGNALTEFLRNVIS